MEQRLYQSLSFRRTDNLIAKHRISYEESQFTLQRSTSSQNIVYLLLRSALL